MNRPTKTELEFTVLQCLNFLRDEKDQFFPHTRVRAEKLLKLTAKTLRNPSLRDANLITLRYQNEEYDRVEKVIKAARKVFNK